MSFAVFTVNSWAVLVSGLAYFVLGALWYGLLGEPWLRHIGRNREDLESRPLDYVVALLCDLLIAFGVAVGLNAFGAQGVADGVFVVTVLWFAFSLLPAIVHYAYEGKTFGLLAINKGYDFVGMVVAAVILSVWS